MDVFLEILFNYLVDDEFSSRISYKMYEQKRFIQNHTHSNHMKIEMYIFRDESKAKNTKEKFK